MCRASSFISHLCLSLSLSPLLLSIESLAHAPLLVSGTSSDVVNDAPHRHLHRSAGTAQDSWPSARIDCSTHVRFRRGGCARAAHTWTFNAMCPQLWGCTAMDCERWRAYRTEFAAANAAFRPLEPMATAIRVRVCEKSCLPIWDEWERIKINLLFVVYNWLHEGVRNS